MPKTSDLEAALLYIVRVLGLPEPVREYQFHPERKWRFDCCWPDLMLAVEVEGGIWRRGRHTRGAGYENDCEKYNQASLMGWTVLRFTSTMLSSGMAADTLEQAFKRLQHCLDKSLPYPAACGAGGAKQLDTACKQERTHV